MTGRRALALGLLALAGPLASLPAARSATATTARATAATAAVPAGAIRVGQPCGRPGVVASAEGQRVVCIRVGSRLVWQIAERVPGGGTFPSTTVAPGATGPAGATTTTRKGAKAPAPLPSVAVPASDAAGRWSVSPGSQVGYRIEERMLGGAFAGTRTAVGRTPGVSGSLVVRRDAQGLAGTVSIDADLKQLASDSARRDQVLRIEGLATDQFPAASFYADVRVPAGADTGRDFALDLTGKLTLKGVARDVAVKLTGRLELGRILLVGSAPITLSDFGIVAPDVAGVVDVADKGQLEFSLIFVKSA